MKEVTAAVIRDAGRILICRRRDGEKHGGLWEFPGGKTEPGEASEDGLRREIGEELGLEVAVGDRLGSSFYGNPPEDIELIAFLAELRSGPNVVLREHAEARWVEPSELDRFVFAPADRPFVALLRNGGPRR